MSAAFPSEAHEARDRHTQRRILQLTSYPSINHHLYFLTSSLTPDETALVFCSYRTGRPEFHRAGFPSGEILRLTDEPGINGFSAIISQDGDELYYTATEPGDPSVGVVRAVRLNGGEPRTLAEFPGGQLGECSASADGEWLVMAIRQSGNGGLAVARTDGSGGEVVLEVGRTVIHPQFHPRSSDWILYAQDPAPRMWMARRDGRENECLYEHGNDEFLVHETFLGDSGEQVVVVRWPYALRRFDLATRQFHDIARFNAWHIAPSRDGKRVLCDTAHPDIGLQLVDVETGERTTVCQPESSCGGSQWRKDRYALGEDFAAARQAAEREASLSWMEMKADTVYGPQWTHPHPSFSRSERWVVYTSDRSGHPQVYAVEL